jgi:hypothetical protein
LRKNLYGRIKCHKAIVREEEQGNPCSSGYAELQAVGTQET